MATDATTPKEANSNVQPQFAQSSAAMNRILNASSDRPADRARLSEPFHGNSSHTVPGDGDRVFAEPPPSNHPSMQYASEGRNFTYNPYSYHAPQGDSSSGATRANFATPWGYSHSSALPYGQGWGGYGTPWQSHPALQQFESLQQRILDLEHRTPVAEGEFEKGYYFFIAFSLHYFAISNFLRGFRLSMVFCPGWVISQAL